MKFHLPLLPSVSALLLVFLVGCGSNQGTIPVSGTVSFDGGPMPKHGTVQFLAIEAADGFSKRPGTGQFDTDGAFQVTSFEEGDGLLPGKYQVCIECWKIPPSMGGPPQVSHLPDKYRNAYSSGLELVVESGSSPITFDIALPADPK